MKDVLALFTKYQAGELTAEQVETAINELKYVPLERLNSKNDQIKSLQDELDQRDNQINQLKKDAKGNEDLTKKLQDMETQNTDWAQKYAALQMDTAIKSAITDTVDIDVTLQLLKRDGLELQEDGKVKGLEEAVNSLRDSKPYLFEQKPPEPQTPQLNGRTPLQTGQPPLNSGVKNPWSKDHFNLTEQGRLLTEQPEVAKQYIAQAGKNPALYGL